mmetsp:Transcript_6506/g.16682  ORF Transcript_6506/g.16682 Transcript_6506/m.16682 type:complete len:397 (+) Transcript_6506:3-1193(+)
MWQHNTFKGSAVRGFGRIKAPLHVVKSVLQVPMNKKRYDENFQSYRMVERINDDTAVVSEKYKGIFPVDGRDFCALKHERFIDDDGWVQCGAEHPHPKCPPTKSPVRGEIPLTGIVLRPAGLDGSETDVHYLVMSDFKGNVPLFLLKQVARTLPMNVYRLGTATLEDLASGRVLRAPLPPPTAQPATSVDQESNRAQAQTALKAVERLNNVVSDNEDGLGDDQPPAQPPQRPISVLADPCIFNTPKIRKACIPSANGHFSARALAKLYGALACGGTLDGAEVLSETTAAKIGVTQSESNLGLSGFSVEWGLGVRKYAFSNGEAVRKTAFGHGGQGGSLALCDPAEEFAVAVTLNKLTLTGEASTRLVNLISTELGVGTFIRYGYSANDESDSGGIF